MGITAEEFVQHYPLLYHMAEAGTWPSIQKLGLMSTSALLDRFGVNGKVRNDIESCHRPVSVRIQHEELGEAVIRDQKPMSDKGLKKCLRDALNPSDWYRVLNSKVFFWLSEERLNRLLAARAYRNDEHTVLTVDAKMLLDRHEDQVTLSPINSGCTVPNPQPRGKDTFLPLIGYPFAEWKNKRGVSQAVVELAVNYEVPAIAAMVLRVEQRRGSKTLEVIYSR